MAYNKYAWSKPAAPTPRVPLVAPIDPEHLTPTPNPDQVTGSQLWVESTPTPTLPDSLTAEPFGTPIGGGGPIDRTPEDPSHGVGVGPGLTTAQSQAVRGALMSEDLGAVAARQYQATIDRDGTRNVAIIPDTPGQGESPDTIALRYRTGVGQPNDPGARLAHRIKRWMDRVIDMHWYEPSYRPATAVFARPVNPHPAVANGNQLTSPFAAFVPSGTPDTFVAPQERRSPVPWDQPLATDGITGITTDFGLPTWGL